MGLSRLNLMMTDPIRILMGSDFHFGAPNINQVEMADAFMETLFPLLPDTDIFFINGDFFDTRVNFDNHGFDPLYDVILLLFHLCEKHQVTLRFLQGTWTHDYNQCRRLEAFYRNSHASFNFRYIDSIDLEEITIRDRTLRFFYIPDDLPFKSSDDIVDVLKSKLIEKDWETVDYGCVHGFFDFTFPRNINQDNRIVFKEAQFPFVKKAIDVGHVHQHRVSNNVFSNGSFDRLVFGDEEPKGCIRFLDHPDHYTAIFVQNHHAAVYDTLVFDSNDDTESMRAKIDTHIHNLVTTRKISLRFTVASSDQYEAIKTWMRETHPDIRIMRKKASEGSEGPKLLTSSLITTTERKLAPNRKTLSAFVRAHIPEDYILTIDAIETYLEP